MIHRNYKDRRLQAQYDAMMEAYRSEQRGWHKGKYGAMYHGLWNDDGNRFRGAGSFSAFWNGFDGLIMKPYRHGGRRRLMYVPGTLSRQAYMAGRDCAKAL